MSPKHLIVAAALALTSAAAIAQETVTEPIKAFGAVTQTEGRVSVVNPDTRMMTIRKADGSFEVIHIPPEVKRINAIRIGNQVRLTTALMALIELRTGPNAGAVGQSGVATEVAPTPGGSKPSGEIVDRQVIFGKITAVDRAAGTVTIEGPNRTATYEVENKELLNRVNAGDGVRVTLTSVIRGDVSFN
jgi:hypothetical protein